MLPSGSLKWQGGSSQTEWAVGKELKNKPTVGRVEAIAHGN